MSAAESAPAVSRPEGMDGRSHPKCWTGDRYEHNCHTPSGRACIDCGEPAGTPWGPYWCPPCDVIRLEGIGASLKSMLGGGQA